DDFLFVGASGVLQNREQHLADFASGRLHVTSVKIDDSTVHVYPNSAVVSSKVSVKGTFGGRDISGPYQFTDTWVKQGDDWLASARQQTRILPPPASAKVREFFAAFAQGNIQGVLDTMSDDVDWFIPGPAIVPYAGKRHGRDEVKS